MLTRLNRLLKFNKAMLNLQNPIQLLIEAASFISAFAAIAAGVIMAKFLRKFVTGILAKGFKTIGIGIFVLSLGIIIDAIIIHTQNSKSTLPFLDLLTILKQALFLTGTYIIVVSSKNMGDKLEKLSKSESA